MIDIIVPTYKPGHYLYDCLKSLDEQDCSKDIFSVIVVLNGDKQPYYNNILNWMSEFEFNYKVLLSQDPGVSKARNIALENTLASYIIFLDDDDILSKNYISSLEYQKIHNGIIVSNVYNFELNLDEKRIDYLSFNKKFSSRNLITRRSYLSNACCKLIPMEVIGKTRFRENLNLSEDAVFMFEISNKIHIICSTMPDVIYYRRLRYNSSSRKRLSLIDRVKIIFEISFAFLSIYLKKPSQYNFFLFLTRLLAIFKKYLI